MTVEQLQNYIPPDVQRALSDDMQIGVSNEEMLASLISDGEQFIDSLVTLTGQARDILVAQFVAWKLYERYGFQEQAKQTFDRLMKIIDKYRGTEDGAVISSSVRVSSAERQFTDEELSKW